MSHDISKNTGCDTVQARPEPYGSDLSWWRAAIILGWLVLGAPIGWAASSLLWRAGYLNPYHDYLMTYLVMVAPMLLTAAFGARHNSTVIRRVVLVPFFITCFLWFIAPCPSMNPRGISNLLVNTYYPYMMVPGAFVGGVIAVLSVKFRSKEAGVLISKYPKG